MDVIVVADGHYLKDEDGNIYAESVYSYSFFKRYLSVFEKVYAIVRLEYTAVAPETAKLCSGLNVEFLPLPPYRGALQYLMNYFTIRKIASEYFEKAPCAIFRIPSATGNLLCKIFDKTKKPYAVEVVVDPWEFFSKGSIKSKLRPFIRISWTLFVKKMCLRAQGVSYVTERYLQNHYPKSNKSFTSSYSSVEIPTDSLKEPRKYKLKRKYTISHASNGFATYGKGHVQLMEAISILKKRGYDLELFFIGDGPLRQEFEEYAKKIDIQNVVEFTGLLPSGTEVRKKIEESDIFVFPTKAEGLPRVLLEAMSSAMPCISTHVCGIPEILDSEFLVSFNDINQLATVIERMISNPELMEKASKDNVVMAAKFTTEVLQKRRIEFYLNLKECI